MTVKDKGRSITRPEELPPPAHLSIGDVSEATGISPDTIRVWERRYGRPRPIRLPSGHRRYSGDQVRWLRRVAEALARGHRPSKAVRASEAELDAMLAPEEQAQAESAEVQRMVALVRGFKQAELERTLRKGWNNLGMHRFFDERVSPLLTVIGRMWADGELDIRHEHFLSELLEDFLRSLRSDVTPPESAPLFLLATLPDEDHGIGLQIAALICVKSGVRTRILGRQTPVSEIIRAARETKADAVGISVSLSSGGVETDRTLAQLRRELPEEVQLVIGGKGARGVRRGGRGIVYLEDLAAFEEWLKGL